MKLLEGVKGKSLKPLRGRAQLEGGWLIVVRMKGKLRRTAMDRFHATNLVKNT